MDAPPTASPPQRLEDRVRELEGALAAMQARHAHERQYWAQLEAILNNAPLATYLKDAQHRYLLVNQEYERLARATRSDILGKTDFEVFPAPVAELFRAQDEEVLAKDQPVEFRESIPLPDGVHVFITSKFPLRTTAGEPFGVAGMCTEVTALAAAQKKLQQAQAELSNRERLASLGELAAMVAHEVRNPLGVIFNALATFRRAVETDELGRSLLKLIAEESERLDLMVTALLELARPEQLSRRSTSVLELVNGAIDAARGLAHARLDVRVEFPVPVPNASVDAPKVHLALLNLLSNAAQANGRRGPVIVRVTTEGVEPSAVLRIDVIDDGDGVPPELAERIFAPFFSRRAKGTGLGLALVRRVAEAHHGSATIEPTPGGGATFVLRLPM